MKPRTIGQTCSNSSILKVYLSRNVTLLIMFYGRFEILNDSEVFCSFIGQANVIAWVRDSAVELRNR